MPNQNGRTNRDDRGERRWRSHDDERSMRDRDDRMARGRDRDDDRYFDRGDRERMTERYGGGQSGYGSGRMGDDRSMGAGYRNQAAWRGEDDDRQGLHTDDRFTGRGGEGYWEDRGDRDYHSGYRMADEYNRGRGYPDMYGPSEYGQRGYGRRVGQQGWGQGRNDIPSDDEQGVGYGQGTGGRWANVPQAGLEGGRGMQQGPQRGRGGYGAGGYGAGYGYGPQDIQGREGVGGHRGKGPVGYMRSDERIKENVCEVLSDDDHIDASHIEVVVKNGEVILTGSVEDRRQKRIAEDVIENLPGVKDVQNQLRVASERSPQRSNPNAGSAVRRMETEADTSTDKKTRS